MGTEGQHPRRSSLRRISDALEGLADETDPLRLAALLRRELDPASARQAAELHRARSRAAGRFPSAERGFFTSKGAQQLTRAQVAAVRAAWIRERLEGCTVLDATCGVGGDSVALARAGLFTVSMDRDPATALCASENLRHLGLSDRTLVGDALIPPVRTDVVVLDPDRRAAGKRSLDPEEGSPALGAVLALLRNRRGGCVKLAPAVDPDALEARLAGEPGLAWRLEWVDLDRELCEVTLWTGALAVEPRPGPGDHRIPGSPPHDVERLRSAVSLEASGDAPVAHRLSGVPMPTASLDPSAVAGIAWILVPNPAVVRAGLVGPLGAVTGTAPLGPGIAWLGGRERPETPFGRAWRVLEVSTADRRRVREMLARHDVGPVTVWKRGHPESPEVLERRFRGAGGRRGLVAVARLARGHAALLLEGP